MQSQLGSWLESIIISNISINVHILGSRGDKIILKRYKPDGKLDMVGKEKEPIAIIMFINILVDAYSKKF